MKKKVEKNHCNLDEAQTVFRRFCETIAALRHPDSGCPWDVEQDHTSLRRYMIEEAYEAIEVMEGGDSQALCEELGDVLLQVVLNAQVAFDQGDFSITEVMKAIDDKMRRRHPHVFAKISSGIDTPEKVRQQWEVLKAGEKKAGKSRKKTAATFSEQEKVYPASRQALAIGKRATKIDFDWPHTKDVWSNLEREVEELKEAIKKAKFKAKAAVYDEVGDVYFSLAQLCRHLGYDPEVTAYDGNRKFLKRFALLEELVDKDGKVIAKLKASELESYWQRAKKLKKKR